MRGCSTVVHVDVTTELDGYHGDPSATFLVGTVDTEAARLVAAARRCRDAGIAAVRDQARLGDAARPSHEREHAVFACTAYWAASACALQAPAGEAKLDAEGCVALGDEA